MEVGNSLQGRFFGLNEGELVGNYGGRDLFITYSAGTGNDIALFTAVPEPGNAAILMFCCAVIMLRHRNKGIVDVKSQSFAKLRKANSHAWPRPEKTIAHCFSLDPRRGWNPHM